MTNPGVRCNVCECKHNDTAANSCTLGCIEVTHEKTGPDSIPNPHYCKSFTQK